MNVYTYFRELLRVSKVRYPVISGWVGGVSLSIPMLAAPIGTYLHFKVGARYTVLLGVFLATLGFGFAALSPNIGVLFLCYGLLGGFGIMMQVNPPFFLLDEYFPYRHPRHVLATSVIACAFPLGMQSMSNLIISLY